jgi:predicted tellurium resistance membrane protein TerC
MLRILLLAAGAAVFFFGAPVLAETGPLPTSGTPRPATGAELWIGLLTLTILEIVLGVDNVIFIAILAGKLPREQQRKGRQLGLVISAIPRVLMLIGIGAIIALEKTPLFNLPFVQQGVTGKDLVLILGGLFLLWKSTKEIHHKLEGTDEHVTAGKAVAVTFGSVMAQMLLINVVFSIDSVITAVGMVRDVWVMIVAVVLSIGFMFLFAEPVGNFVESHPTVKILALSFLILIGATLIIEGLHQHIPKGYVYFAMAFSAGVEMINLRVRKKGEPVRLHHPVP